MTLCIAAACRYKNRDAVILGSDFMVEGTTKQDILDKLYWIHNKQWPILISGDDVSKAIELKEVYRQLLEKPGTITLDGLPDLMHDGLRIQKARLAAQYVSQQLGMSYDAFLDRSRHGSFLESTRASITAGVRKLKYECDLIIVVFVTVITQTGRARRYKRPLIFTAGDEGLHWCEQYGCVGSGFYAADAMLAYRKQGEDTTAQRTMYHVHEALTLGATVAPGVGEGALAIVYDNGKEIVAEQPRSRYREKLETLFKRRLGPRTVKNLPNLRPSDLHEF